MTDEERTIDGEINEDTDLTEQLRGETSEEPSFRKDDFSNPKEVQEKKNKQDSKHKKDLVDEIIDNVNKYFLIKILSPEITNNEEKKRLHKDHLIDIVKKFLVFQFILLVLMVPGTIISTFIFHALGNDIPIDYLEMLIKFISVYITSVVVELIAMLNYIVSNVFDTSITTLVELYRDATNNESKKDS